MVTVLFTSHLYSILKENKSPEVQLSVKCLPSMCRSSVGFQNCLDVTSRHRCYMKLLIIVARSGMIIGI